MIPPPPTPPSSSPPPSLDKKNHSFPPRRPAIASNAAASASSSSSSSNPLTQYHPSVFRYTCRGHLALDKNKRPFEAGVCRGIQSQLEVVDHWRLMTSEEAIQTFQAKAALHEADATEFSDAAAAAAAGAATSHDDATAHAVQAVYMSNVLVYPIHQQPPSPPQQQQQQGRSAASKDEQQPLEESTSPSSTSSSSSPPLSLSLATSSSSSNNTNNNTNNNTASSSTEEQWHCYGSTEVDLLVLRPKHSKQEQIAAVNPYCAPGMTIRDISTTPNTINNNTNNNTISKERTSTIRLGFVEILYQTNMEEEGNDQTQKQSLDSTSKHHHSSSTLPWNPKLSSPTAAAAASTSTQPQDIIHMWTRFTDSSRKVALAMKYNAMLLYQATQEDYAARTLSASNRIVQEFPKTLDRTLTLMRRVLEWDWESPPPPPPRNGSGRH